MTRWFPSHWSPRVVWRTSRTVLRLRAHLWRLMLRRTTFIGITGSIGKTTTKECLAGILSTKHKTAMTRYNRNGARGVPRTILRVKRRHRYAVVEIGTDIPGQIQRSAAIVRPKIAIILTVARTHTDNFKTLEDTAAEKSALLDFLPRDGIAILNAEDPRVIAMAAKCRCEVKTFGRSPKADIWAEEVTSKWPARLSFRARTASESEWVTTNFVGEQWVNSVLAALLAARCCGMPLRDAVAAVTNVQPFLARMQPVRLPSGAMLIRDEGTASADTVDPALKALRDATAQRRILIVSDTSDSGLRTRTRLRALGAAAAEISELAVFIGASRHHTIKAALAAGMAPEYVRDFETVQEAAEFLKSELREGDVALVKGRGCDHLERIYLSQLGPVACWKTKCRIRGLCDMCKELRPPAGASVAHPVTGGPRVGTSTV